MSTVTQTILHSDPSRPGNCFAACVATALNLPLDEVLGTVTGAKFEARRLRDAADRLLMAAEAIVKAGKELDR